MSKRFIAVVMACLVAGGAMALPAAARVDVMAKHKPVAHRTLVGTVKTVAASSFVLTAKKKNYTVTVKTTTRLTNRLHKKIALDEMYVGDKVQVVGTSTALTVFAETVRDLTLPRHTSSTRSAVSGE